MKTSLWYHSPHFSWLEARSWSVFLRNGCQKPKDYWHWSACLFRIATASIPIHGKNGKQIFHDFPLDFQRQIPSPGGKKKTCTIVESLWLFLHRFLGLWQIFAKYWYEVSSFPFSTLLPIEMWRCFISPTPVSLQRIFLNVLSKVLKKDSHHERIVKNKTTETKINIKL